MAKNETVKFKGQDIEIKELTCDQLDDALDQDAKPSKIDIAFDAEMVSQKMLEVSTGITGSELRQTAISDLRPLVEAIKTVNSDFFTGLRAIMAKAGQ